MKRRTALQWLASALAALPFARVRVGAQAGQLTDEAVATLREVGRTVLPSALGDTGIDAAVDRFVAWTRGYREGVPLAHGYGRPRLRLTPASPAPRYVAELAAIDRAARAKGDRFGALDLETRRAVLDEALATAEVRSLPRRPAGQHVVADLMGHYFGSSEALDLAYLAYIGRQKCRPIAVTTERPKPLGGRGGGR